MIKILTLIFCLFITGSCFTQNDSNIIGQYPAYIHLGHKIGKFHYYRIDGLLIKKILPGSINIETDEELSNFDFHEQDIKKLKLSEDTLEIETHLVIVFDTIVLEKQNKKNKYLSRANQNKILSIERLSKDEAIKQYGKLGEKGVVIIKTKKE